MKRNDIEEFIAQSIAQVKKGVPKGCVLQGKFDFDISVATERKTGGNINIRLAGAEHTRNIEQTHRIRFSIIDTKSQERTIESVRTCLKGIISDLSTLDR